MEKIEQQNKELDELITKAEAILDEEELKKLFEENDIPEKEEEISPEINERG